VQIVGVHGVRGLAHVHVQCTSSQKMYILHIYIVYKKRTGVHVQICTNCTFAHDVQIVQIVRFLPNAHFVQTVHIICKPKLTRTTPFLLSDLLNHKQTPPSLSDEKRNCDLSFLWDIFCAMIFL